MNKTNALALLTGILLLFAGCGTNAPADNIKLASEAPAESIVTEIPSVESPPEVSEENPAVSNIGQRLGGAVKDAYAGIEIDAYVRERKAILPGFAVPVTVTVKNTGSQTVDYIWGSGSYKSPEALFINVNGLQTVLPPDRLGPATMDFRTEELKPGDTLEYVMYVMAIEPNANFDTYSIKMHSADSGYIAEKGWDELQKEFPDLVAAKSGSYEGQAYFLYYIRNESGTSDFTEMPTGYAEHSFSIGVS